MKKLLCLILAVVIMASMPITAIAETITGSPFRDSKFTHQTKFNGMNIINGLDLSHHNGDVDFAKIKNAGVEFVILRLAARGYGYAGGFVNDTKFKEYYDGAKKVGLPIGAYIFSQAITEKEAIEEAEKALKILDGRKLDLPLVFDYEFSGGSDGRLTKAWNNRTLNRDKMTNNAIAFCEKVKKNGYSPMVYASEYFFYDNLNASALENRDYGIWLAHYTQETDYKGKFDIWQYSERGTVNGIKGNVDCNFMYVDPIELPKPVVKLTSEPTTTTVELKWNKVEGADGYEVIRKSGDNFIHLGDTTSTKFKATSLTPATNNYIGVRAYRLVSGVKHYGKLSARVKATTKPAKVTGIKAESKTDTEITLTWKKVGSPTRYNVYMYDRESKTYQLIAKPTQNKLKISGLKQNRCYYFKVEACKDAFVGTRSDRKGIYTRPKPPTVKNATSPREKRITITWAKSTRFDGYQVQWSTTKDFSSNTKTSSTSNASATSKTIKTYRTKEYYSIRVRGYIIRDGKKVYSAWSDSRRLKVK